MKMKIKTVFALLVAAAAAFAAAPRASAAGLLIADGGFGGVLELKEQDVRVTINNYESIISNAEKRALRCKENEIVPRISDLHSILASTSGKIEMEYVGEDKKEDELVEKLLNRSIVKVFDQYFSLNSLQKVVEYFNSGWGVEVSDQMASQDYLEGIKEIPGLKEAIRTLGIQESPTLMASATEFVLEGLHLHQKLNKEIEGGRVTYGK